MKRNFEQGIYNAPQAGTDHRANAYQTGMANLVGPQGYLPPAYEQDTRQFSSVPLNTLSVPASTAAGIPNSRIEQVGGQLIEFKTVFAANSGDLEVMLGANGVAPLTPTSSSAFILERIRVNSHMPEQVPESGRVRAGTLQREQRVGTLSSYGVGFEMPVRAYMDRDGPMYLRIAIEQMTLGMVDFMILLVYNMLLNAFDWGLTRYMTIMTQKGLHTQLRYVDWLERDRRFLGAMQRDEHPLESIMGYVDEQQRLIQQTHNVLLINHRLDRYMHNIRAYTEYFRAGQGGPGVVAANYGAAIAARLNVAVHIVRTNVIDDEGEFDFMSGHRRYGEFVPMVSTHTPSAGRPYQTRWLDTWIMDARTDTWQRVTLRQALQASGRWGPDGKLVNINSFGDYEGTAASYDPFHRASATGGLEPIAFWGELPNVTVDNVRDINGKMDDDVKAALVVLNDYANQSRASRHTLDTERVFGEIVADPAAPVTSASVPPYMGTYAGLTLIAERLLIPSATKNDTSKAITDALAIINGEYGKEKAQIIVDNAIGANYPRILLNKSGTANTQAGRGLRTAAAMASPIQIGAALQISHGAREAVERGLLAEAGRLGLAADRNVVAARSLLTNYGYTNVNDAAGVHATEYMRGLMLGAMQHVATDGAASDVSARIGSYMEWLHSKNYVSTASLAAPATSSAPATAEQARGFAASLRDFMATDVGKNTFGNSAPALPATLRSVAAQATNVTVADVGARLAGAAHIGLSALDTLPGKESVYDRVNLQWTSAQLPGYLAIVNDKTVAATLIKLTDPARPGEVASIAELEEVVRLGSKSDSVLRSDYANVSTFGRQMATKLREVAAQVSNPAEIAQIVDFLTRPTDWASVEEMLRTDVPIPVTPLLMRWRAVLDTAGMIATERRSALTAYGFPRVSSTTDDGTMRTRLTSLFEAGAFIINEKATYHINDILITGISATGMNVDFATRDGLQEEMQGGQPTGSIVVILEPNYDPYAQLEAISAYGSWQDAGVQRLNLADMTQLHFSSRDWMRKYWGVAPPPKSTDPFNDVRGDFLTMWRGAACYYDPVKDRRGKIQRGCGPVASYFFYDSGMFGAWNRGTAYPAQSQVKAMVS